MGLAAKCDICGNLFEPYIEKWHFELDNDDYNNEKISGVMLINICEYDLATRYKNMQANRHNIICEECYNALDAFIKSLNPYADKENKI